MTGTTGQPLPLNAYYFSITSYINWSLYQYRVDFNPVEDRFMTKKGLVSQQIIYLVALSFSMMFDMTEVSLLTFKHYFVITL